MIQKFVGLITLWGNSDYNVMLIMCFSDTLHVFLLHANRNCFLVIDIHDQQLNQNIKYSKLSSSISRRVQAIDTYQA